MEALRALVEGGKPEETLAEVLARERKEEQGDGADGGDEEDEVEGGQGGEGSWSCSRCGHGGLGPLQPAGVKDEQGSRPARIMSVDDKDPHAWSHTQQVGSKWRAVGLGQKLLGVEWSPVFPPDKKGLLQRLWRRE